MHAQAETEATTSVPWGAGWLACGASSWSWDPDLASKYYRARYYDPKVGRFISEDPFSVRSNMYAYADNAPGLLTDPRGLYPESKRKVDGIYVICCYPGGGIGICRGSEPMSTDPNVDSCMIEHEERHIQDLNADRFPCDKSKCAFRVQEHYPVAPGQKNPTECSAYCWELECLKKKKPWPKVRERIGRVEAAITKYCGKKKCT
jgi:RHS repeat-associated protein